MDDIEGIGEGVMGCMVVIPEFERIIEKSMNEGNCGQRNTDILLYILEMVERGDSKETIHDVYYFLSSYREPEK